MPIRSLPALLRVIPPFLRRQRLITTLLKARLISPTQELAFNDTARAWVDLRDAESRANYLARSFWPEFPPIVAAFLRSGGDLFDVGANFGLVTFGVAPLVAGLGTRLHLFEANPRIVPLLRRSAGLLPDEVFVVNHCCVTDTAGESRLNLPSTSWGHGHIGEEGEVVPNVMLDDYIAAHDVRRVAFLKLDIEGWEVRALRGGQRALSSGVVRTAFVEVSGETLHRAGSTQQELVSLLTSQGFDLYFCALWDHPDPFQLRWITVPIQGTPIRFAQALPLPAAFVQGDVLCLHRENPLSSVLRSSFS